MKHEPLRRLSNVDQQGGYARARRETRRRTARRASRPALPRSQRSSTAAAAGAPRTDALGGPTRSLTKAFRILEHFCHHGPELGVTEIAAALNFNKSTVYRLLSTMVTCGLVEQNGHDGKYRVGLRLFEWGCTAIRSRTLQPQARPLLVEMARKAGETAHLAMYDDGDVVYLDRIEGQNTFVTIPTAIGRRRPAHCSGVGKVLLAFQPAEELDAALSRKVLKAFTENTMTSKEELLRHLQEVRRRGYAIDNQEVERGLTCVAAPIFNHERRVVAAISLAGPSARFRGEELADRIALVKDTAVQISRTLGHRE